MTRLTSKGKLLFVIGILGSVISLLLSGCGSTAGTTTPNIETTASSSTITTTSGTTQAANAVVSALPSVATVSPGANFDVVIQIQTDVPSRGFQCILNWDPTKIQVNSVEEGDFYQGFAKTNSISQFISPQPLDFDNSLGKFPAGLDPTGAVIHYAGIALLGGSKMADGSFIGPSGTGNAFILHMTALNGVSGTVNFTLSQVKLNNNGSPPVNLNATVKNGQITISGGN